MKTLLDRDRHAVQGAERISTSGRFIGGGGFGPRHVEPAHDHGAQLGGRLIDGTLRLLGVEPIGIVILSLAELSGSLLAAASFLALAGTLTAGAHIRITMLLQALPPRARHALELWAFGAAAIFSGYIAWQIASFAFVSFQYDEISPGVVRFPLAVPQAAMAVGAIIMLWW